MKGNALCSLKWYSLMLTVREQGQLASRLEAWRSVIQVVIHGLRAAVQQRGIRNYHSLYSLSVADKFSRVIVPPYHVKGKLQISSEDVHTKYQKVSRRLLEKMTTHHFHNCSDCFNDGIQFLSVQAALLS